MHILSTSVTFYDYMTITFVHDRILLLTPDV